MCDSQVIRRTRPTLPSLLSTLKDFPVHVQAMCDTEGTSIILILCALFLKTAGPEHEINLRGAPYDLVKTLLVLMTDVISEGSGEHVCLHNLVRVSLTNKVLKIAINNQIPQNGTF